MLLNLFLAILLNFISANLDEEGDETESEKEDDDEEELDNLEKDLDSIAQKQEKEKKESDTNTNPNLNIMREIKLVDSQPRQYEEAKSPIAVEQVRVDLGSMPRKEEKISEKSFEEEPDSGSHIKKKSS